MKTRLKNAFVDVVSDLYDAGPNEDGHPFVAEVFFVQIELLDGRRFRHVQAFRGTERAYDEEGCPRYPDLRKWAKARAQTLADRVESAGFVIDLAFWCEVDPCYGSDAYIAQGIEEQRAYEDRFAA